DPRPFGIGQQLAHGRDRVDVLVIGHDENDVGAFGRGGPHRIEDEQPGRGKYGRGQKNNNSKHNRNPAGPIRCDRPRNSGAPGRMTTPHGTTTTTLRVSGAPGETTLPAGSYAAT